MIINNFKEILTSNEVQMQEEFYKIAMDSVKMIETDQININSAEELINIFLRVRLCCKKCRYDIII